MKAVETPVQVGDLHPAIVHLMGPRSRITLRARAELDVCLTGVKHTRVVKEVLG